MIDTTRGAIACECGHEIADHDDQTRPGYPDGGRCHVMVSLTEQCPCTAAHILTPEIRSRLERAERLTHDRRHFAEAVVDRNQQIDRLTRERDAYARAKAENDERFQLEAGEQRQKAEFYAEVLVEVKDMLGTGAGVVDTPLEAIYNKVVWALDPLADHHPRRS